MLRIPSVVSEPDLCVDVCAIEELVNSGIIDHVCFPLVTILISSVLWFSGPSQLYAYAYARPVCEHILRVCEATLSGVGSSTLVEKDFTLDGLM